MKFVGQYEHQRRVRVSECVPSHVREEVNMRLVDIDSIFILSRTKQEWRWATHGTAMGLNRVPPRGCGHFWLLMLRRHGRTLNIKGRETDDGEWRRVYVWTNEDSIWLLFTRDAARMEFT